jgi:hypothetical protein
VTVATCRGAAGMDGSAPWLAAGGEVDVATRDHQPSGAASPDLSPGGRSAVAADLVYEEFALCHSADDGGDRADDGNEHEGVGAPRAGRHAADDNTSASVSAPLVVVYRWRLLRRPAAADPTELAFVRGVAYPAFLTEAHLEAARARVRQMTSSESVLTTAALLQPPPPPPLPPPPPPPLPSQQLRVLRAWLRAVWTERLGAGSRRRNVSCTILSYVLNPLFIPLRCVVVRAVR